MVTVIELVAVGLVTAIALPLFVYFFPPKTIRPGLRAFERRTGVPPALSAGVIVVATLVFVGTVAGTDDVGLVDGLGAAAGVFGPLFLAVAVGRKPALTRIRAATGSETGRPGTGPVVVDGELEAAGEGIPTPVGEAVTCAFALQRGRRSHRSTAWQTLVEGERTVPLAIDDGSGPVRVDTEATTVRTGLGGDVRRAVVDVEGGESVPDEVAAFLSGADVDVPTRPAADHRLKLRYLRDGDVVTAVGDHERVTRHGAAFWGLTRGDGEAFLFAGNRGRVRAQLRRSVYWLGPVGACLTLVGVGYLGVLWGVV